MRKAAQTSMTANVLAFPERCAVAPAKSRRKPCKAKRSNVLAFTGPKRNNYDGKAELPNWQTVMLGFLARMVLRVQAGEVTGLCIVSAEGIPTDDDDPSGRVNMLGVFAEDVPYAARTLETVGTMVEGIAAKRPARPV